MRLLIVSVELSHRNNSGQCCKYINKLRLETSALFYMEQIAKNLFDFCKCSFKTWDIYCSCCQPRYKKNLKALYFVHPTFRSKVKYALLNGEIVHFGL